MHTGTRAAKVMEREWQQRLQQQEQQWALKQKDLEKRWAGRLVEAGRQARSQKAAAEEAGQQQLQAQQAQHANHVRQLQSKAQQTEWQTTNERALLQKWVPDAPAFASSCLYDQADTCANAADCA